MAVLGYSEYHAGNQLFSVALNLRYLVAGLFLFSALMQFIGLALVYNLDKKTLEKMNAELDARRKTNATENKEGENSNQSANGEQTQEQGGIMA